MPADGSLFWPQADVPFSRLLRLNRPELLWAILGCCASAVLGGQAPAFAVALSGVITIFYKSVRPAALFALLLVRHGMCASKSERGERRRQ